MKITKKFIVMLAASLPILSGSSAVAKSMWQTIEFDEPSGITYVGCLGEEVSSYVWYSIRYREFETPSGTSHYVAYWRWDAEMVGLATGRVWLSEGRSPESVHAAQGEVGQWTSNELAIPVVGDGPRLRYNMRLKYTFNANGELKVLALPPDDLNDWFRCLGPKD